ncbi:hypothetical protein SR870_22990 [Rhodopseudomonas palustris]|uniref:hypothetical protein n=1 Tax=Rhodopseudomonas palustris TaxID=1076 RepID=UPI002ACEB8D9|nr:hypothetical protein [Rhodopseudomonas palustris]WQG99499.1 hypothetical protein SR870_22990 [Rhodopseudomonas palustris]
MAAMPGSRYQADGPIPVRTCGDGHGSRRRRRDPIESIDVIGAASTMPLWRERKVNGRDKAAFDLDHMTGTHSDRRH